MSYMKNSQSIFFMLLLGTWSYFGFAADAPGSEAATKIKTFIHGEETFTASLSESAWRHIVEGKKTESSFPGGHDWSAYKKNLKKDDTVFFDTVENAYIVSSEKGDSLLEIIEKYGNNQQAKFHALFPEGVLNKNFVIDAFIAAFKDNRIDFNRGLFFGKHQGFSVAGFFERHRNTFKITTLFPDLSWFYRIDFKHHKNDLFEQSRFFKREFVKRKEIWTCDGVSADYLARMQDINLTKYWPSAVRTLSTQAAGGASMLTGKDFVLENEVKAYLQQKWIAPNMSIDVISLFFKNPDEPTPEEVALLQNTFKSLFPEYNRKRALVPAKKTVNAIKLMLGGALRSDNWELTETFYDDGILSQADKSVGTQAHNFGEEVLKELLHVNLFSNIVDDASVLNQHRVAGAKTVVKNLTQTLIDDENLRKRFLDANYMFTLAFVPRSKKGDGDYVISIVQQSGLRKNMKLGEVQYTMIFIVGADSLSKLKFRNHLNLAPNAFSDGEQIISY